MALYGIGNTKIEIIIRHNIDWKAYKLVVKDGITISRSINEPAVLNFECRRDKISVEYGDYIQVVIDDHHEQFAGYVEKVTHKKGWSSVTAYDHLWFLQKNTAAKFAYEDIYAHELYRKIIEENHLPITDPPQIMETFYKIPGRVEDNVHYLDIMQTALRLTKENSKQIFYIWDDFGNLCLHSEEWLSRQPKVHINAGFIEDYDFTNDGSDFYTAAKMVGGVVSSDVEKTGEESKKEDKDKDKEIQNSPKTVYDVKFAYDEENIPRYGYREAVGTFAEGENGDEKARNLLNEHQNFTRTMNIKGCQGDITVRGGTPLLVDFFTDVNRRCEYIRGWFRTKQVTHSFNSGHHTMDLQLEQIRWIDDWDNPNPDFSFDPPEKLPENPEDEPGRHQPPSEETTRPPDNAQPPEEGQP